jgi:type I restriction enzyme S subunit
MEINNLIVGDICNFIGGSQPPKSVFINEPKEGYIRLIQTRDYKTDSFPTYIPEHSTNKFCDEQDIMIGRYGPPIFQICRGLKGAYNVALLKAKPKKGIDREFLYYFLKQDALFRYIDKLSARTGGQTGVDLISLNKYPVRIPTEEISQQKLVAVLCALDQKININKRIYVELEQMVKTLYKYWFVQFDFPDTNGNPYKSSGGKMIYNSVLKREIPAGWGADPLSAITIVSNDSVNPAEYPDKEFKLFSIPIFDATNTYSLELGKMIGSNKFTVLGTDLLVSKLNPWFNRIVFAMDENDQICSTEFIVWRNSNTAIKNFLYLIATSEQFITHCSQSATGTSNSHKRVNPDVMMRFSIPFNFEIAKIFGELIEPMLKELIVKQRENTKLANIRDWLLPMLMNEQVIVN